MKRRVASCIGAICLLSAGPVAAQGYDRSGPYLGVGGVYAARWVPGDFDDDLGMGATVRVDNTGGVNARLGYRANRWLAGELEYEWLDGFDVDVKGGGGGFRLRQHALTVNGKLLYPGWGRFQPWFVTGIGLSIQQAQRRSGVAAGLDPTSTGFAARFGLGLDAYLTESWLATFSVEAVVNTTTIDNSIGGDLDQFFYVPIQLGVQYRF